MTENLKQKLDMILEHNECSDSNATLHENSLQNTAEKKNTDVSKYFLMICIILCIAYLLYRMKSSQVTAFNMKSQGMINNEEIESEEIEIHKENDRFEKNKDVFFQEF